MEAVGAKKGKAVIMPVTLEYIERTAGATGSKRKLLKALKEEKAGE